MQPQPSVSVPVVLDDADTAARLHHFYHYQASFAFQRLGECCLALAEYKRAIAAFDKAIFQDHINGFAFAGRAAAWQALGEGDRAAADSSRAEAFGAQGGYGKVADEGEIALRLGEDYCRSNAALREGEMARTQGDIALAAQHFTCAAELSLAGHDAYHRAASALHVVRGKELARQKAYDLAISDFTKAINLHVKNVDAYLARAETYLAKGNHFLATLDYKNVLKFSPGHAGAAEALRQIEIAKGAA